LEDGRMNMPNARDWTTSLNIGGVTGWRLPDVTPVDGLQFNTSPSYDGSTDVGYNVSAPGSAYPGTTVSELAHMFYATLGNTGRIDMGGINNPAYGLINTGPFTFPSNPYYDTLPYWTGVLVDPTDWEGSAYVFTLNEGQQRPDDNLIGLLYSWPVHDGDAWPVQGSNVAVIPLPPVFYLFGSGLLGLIGIARKNVSSKDVIAAATSPPARAGEFAQPPIDSRSLRFRWNQRHLDPVVGRGDAIPFIGRDVGVTGWVVQLRLAELVRNDLDPDAAAIHQR